MDDERAAQMFRDLKSGYIPNAPKRNWPFKTMKVDEYESYTDRQEFLKAKNAAFGIQCRTDKRFRMCWQEERQFGVIGRVI